MTIRPFELGRDDVDELTRLLHAAYRELLEMGLAFTATRQTAETTRDRIAGAHCLLAIDEGRMIGTATVDRGGPHHRVAYYQSPTVAVFSQFGVDPQRRGEGIGKALLAASEDWARAAGCTELALDTSDQAVHLIELYEMWGFSIVDRHDWRPGVNYLSVVMSKRLADP